MTKTYNAIPIEDYYVVVDKESRNTAKWFISDSGKLWEITDLPMTFAGFIAVIATIGKRIGDLPLIEMSNPLDRRKPVYMVKNPKGGKNEDLTFDVQLFEDLEEAKEWCKPYSHLEIVTEWIVEAGTKKYSEEDMRNAFNAGSTDNYDIPLDKCGADNYLASLDKSVSSVELEVVEGCDSPFCSPLECGCLNKYTLKISEQNIITPVKINR